MLTMENIFTEEGAVEAITLSSGEYFDSIEEFFNYCNDGAKRVIHTESSLSVEMALKGKKLKHKGSSSSKLVVGKVSILNISKWSLDIKADKESVEKLEGLMLHMRIKGDELPLTPAMAAIFSFSSKTRKLSVDKLHLNEALIGSTDFGNKLKDMTFQPAYYGGLLGRPAVKGQQYKNVKSYDLSSAYPASALLDAFPSGEGEEHFNVDSEILSEYEENSKKGFLGLFKAKGLRRKDWVRLPAYSTPDLKKLEIQEDAVYDEAGLLSGDFVFGATKPELKLFKMQYDFEELEVLELYTHELLQLPLAIKKIFIESYELKSKTEGAERLAHKLKINATIGAWGRDPLKNVFYKNESLEEAEKSLKVYNGSDTKKPSSLTVRRTWDYRWALYINSYTRLKVAETEKALYDNGATVLYSDTDSIKFIENDFNSQELFDELNNATKVKSDRLIAYLGGAFDISDIGLWEDESSEYIESVFFEKRVYFKASENGKVTPVASGAEKKSLTEQLKDETIKGLSMKNEIRFFTPLMIPINFGDLEFFGSNLGAQRVNAVFTITK